MGDYKMTDTVSHLVETNEYNEILFKIFTEYVERHQKLLKYIEDVDNFFSNYFIVKMGTYIAYLITILYLMLLVSFPLKHLTCDVFHYSREQTEL